MLKKDLAVLTLGWTFAAAWGAALPVLAGFMGCRPAATDSAGTEKSPTSATPAPTYPAHFRQPGDQRHTGCAGYSSIHPGRPPEGWIVRFAAGDMGSDLPSRRSGRIPAHGASSRQSRGPVRRFGRGREPHGAPQGQHSDHLGDPISRVRHARRRGPGIRRLQSPHADPWPSGGQPLGNDDHDKVEADHHDAPLEREVSGHCRPSREPAKKADETGRASRDFRPRRQHRPSARQ